MGDFGGISERLEHARGDLEPNVQAERSQVQFLPLLPSKTKLHRALPSPCQQGGVAKLFYPCGLVSRACRGYPPVPRPLPPSSHSASRAGD